MNFVEVDFEARICRMDLAQLPHAVFDGGMKSEPRQLAMHVVAHLPSITSTALARSHVTGILPGRSSR
jgi:hypothetical protein